MFSSYLELAKLQIKTSLVYRLMFMSSIVISPVILFMYTFIWTSVYENTGEVILGYNLSDMIAYYVISMIIGHVIFNMVGNRMQEKVMYGDLVQDLLKPVSVFSQFLMREIGERSFAFIVEAIPVFILSIVFFKLRIFSSIHTAIFAAGLILAFFINFVIAYLIGLAAFWVKNIQAFQWLTFIFIRFLSGEFLPLEFLGEKLFSISKFLPFYYIRYGLIHIYLGNFSVNEALKFLGIQVFWVIFLYLLIKIVWHFALKKFGAVGG